ncbi:MAG: ABC transporter ATP-binding protein [Candidatus Heimdallarchaeota archaeon]
MVTVRLEHVSKQFGSVVAVDDISLGVNEGEFFTLLGPSGCGKTTTLRMIAGFYKPDKGNIYFSKTRINNISPHKRDTGMVFQNYALWPHMTIFSNVAFGLQMRKFPREEITKRVKQILELVGMAGMEDRNPGQLSGGQQQRVALARALVIEPQVLLLDEPLSNLDAKLRVEMRTEIRRIQKELAITSIYVTHDQEESLSISDRIAIMNKGRLEQVGTPREIYEQPKNKFVAEFIGSINFIKGTIVSLDGPITTLDTAYGKVRAQTIKSQKVAENQKVLCAVRPEVFRIISKSQAAGQKNAILGTVEQLTYLGDTVKYQIRAEETEQVFSVSIQNTAGRQVFESGEKVILTFSEKNTRLVII